MIRKPVNERQLEVLHWIAEGCPDGRWPDFTYKTTAVALQGRGLAKVSKRGGWHADITNEGRFYISHGRYQDELPRRHGDPAARRRERPVRPHASERQQKQQKQQDQLPQQEDASGESANTAAVSIDPNPQDSVRVPDDLRRAHQVVAALRDDKKAFDVVGPARVRALRIIQGLAAAADSRGWQTRLPQERRDHWGRAQREDAHFVIDTGEYQAEVRVEQEKDRTKHALTPSEERALKRNPWVRIPEWDYSPTERLRIHLPPTWGPRGESRCSWGDGKRGALISKLPGVLEEIARRSDAERERRLKREEEEAERARRWQSAKDRAARLLVQTHRAGILVRQAEDWLQATQLREYVKAMQALSQRGEASRVSAEWIAWAEGYCERLDPLNQEIAMPVDPEPTADALKPFMEGWSHHRPGGY